MSSTLLPSHNSTPMSTQQPNLPGPGAARRNPAPSDLSASQADAALIKRLWSKRTTAVVRTVAVLSFICTVLGLWAAFSGTYEAKGANGLAGKANLLAEWTANLTFYEFCESVSPRLHPTCRDVEPSVQELILRRRIGIVQAATRSKTTPRDRRRRPLTLMPVLCNLMNFIRIVCSGCHCFPSQIRPHNSSKTPAQMRCSKLTPSCPTRQIFPAQQFFSWFLMGTAPSSNRKKAWIGFLQNYDQVQFNSARPSQATV